ncbi:MAG: sugar ABC transporter permease [Spirochaetales bacterium]|jgi:multiple sugar transport system permease protein|nr:sugar ABC transporter permease [Spirochaetales bacterium]
MRLAIGARSLKNLQPYFFILPAMLILAALLVYPLVQVFSLSFFEGSAFARVFAGLNNYFELLRDRIFWQALGHTFIFTFASVFFHFLIGLFLAMLLHQKISPAIRGVFRGLLILPWLIAPTVAAMIWMLIYYSFGILNGILSDMGLLAAGNVISWVGDPELSLFSVTVVNIWRGFPFTLVMLLAALQGIPDEMYEAARIDGASATKSFFYITLPSLKGTMMTVGLLDTIWTFRHFDIIFAMTGGGPMNSSEVLTTNIYNLAFRAQRWGYSSATAVMMFLLMLVFSLLYIRQIGKEGV